MEGGYLHQITDYKQKVNEETGALGRKKRTESEVGRRELEAKSSGKLYDVGFQYYIRTVVFRYW